MSSILKALKKIEKEKGPQQSGTSPIAREILTEISRPHKRVRSHSRLPLILLVLLAGGVLGGVLLMQDAEIPPSQTVLHNDDIAPVAEPVVPVVSVVPPVITIEPPAVSIDLPGVAVETPDSMPIPVVEAAAEIAPAAGPDTQKEIVLTTREATEALKDTATSLRDTAAALKNKVIISTKAADNLSIIDSNKAVSALANQSPIVPVAVAQPRPATSVRSVSASVQVPVSSAARTPGWYLSQAETQVMPELKVSEIHWRPVAKERLAVVNDLPVLEGVDIEGARVDRIFKDRIRFVVNGRYLEVKVSSEPAP